MCASADKSHQVLEEKIKRVLQNCVAKLIGNAISVALIVKEPCPNVNTGYIYGGYGELLDMLDMRIPLTVPDNAQKINIFDDLEDVSVECSPFKKQRGTMAGSCVGSTQLPEQIVSSHARVINRDSLTQETEPQHHIKVGQTTGPGLEMEVFEDTQPDHDAVVIKKEVPDDFPEEILPKQQKSMFVSSSVKNINSQSDATARSIRDRTQTGSEEDDPCTDAENFIGDETGSETVASVTMATRTETRVPPLVSAKEEVYDDDSDARLICDRGTTKGHSRLLGFRQMTPAERSRKYREMRKMDSVKWSKCKEKDRERKARKYIPSSKLSTKERKKRREKWRNQRRDRRHRMRRTDSAEHGKVLRMELEPLDSSSLSIASTCNDTTVADDVNVSLDPETKTDEHSVSATGTSDTCTVQNDIKFVLPTSISMSTHRKRQAASKQRQLVCKETSCNYRTTNAGNMKRHYVSHDGSHVKCNQCKAKFPTESVLVGHMKRAHQATPLICEYCSRTFTTPQGLNRHRSVDHMERSKYTCQICGKKYNEKGNFIGHLNSHTDNKPYSCSTCKKSFVYKGSHTRHVAKCSGLSQVPVSQCDQCHAVLSSPACLKQHIQGMHIDAGHQCSCGKLFKWKQSLDRHQKSCVVSATQF